VQQVPASAEAPQRAVGRGGGQRHQQRERGEPDRYVRTLRDVGEDRPDIEPEVECDPVGEMQYRIRERPQPYHPAQAQQPRLAQFDCERRDAQRREQQPQRPLAEFVLQRIDRVCAKPGAGRAQRARQQPPERQRAGREQQCLAQPWQVQKLRTRSMPR